MFLIEPLEEYDLLSLWIACEEGLLHLITIIFDYGICRFDDHLRRAIVLFEIDHFCVRIVFLEVDDILYVSTTPAIDPLPVISDDTEITRLADEDTDDIVLERVRILILVYHEVLESAMEILSHLVDIEDLSEAEEEIIEVESIILAHLTHVCLIDFEDDRSEI